MRGQGQIRLNIGAVCPRYLTLPGFKPGGIVAQIATVGQKGVVAQAPLHPQGVEKGVDDAFGLGGRRRGIARARRHGPIWRLRGSGLQGGGRFQAEGLIFSLMRAALPRRSRM